MPPTAPSLGFLLFLVSSLAAAQDLWVDPLHGSDANGGASRAEAVRTLAEAWRRIPMSSTLTNGVRIQLTAGVHLRSSVPVYFESRWGTAAAPIVINSADGPRAARVEGDFNVYDVRYLSLTGLLMRPDPPGDVFHCELCDHIVIRDCELDGRGGAQESIKVNQSQYVSIESSDVHGAYDNAIDFVAVQYATIANNRIHDADDWCAYTKGGSAYVRVESNEIYDCGTGGFTAGQGTGFQFMTPPWLHYEAYDVKVVNNVVHDTEGAGLGVNGGYNILFAFNTLVRVGSRSHMLEVVFGARSCDGQPGDADRVRCQSYLALGGWGTTVVSDGTNDVRIPNRNVFIYENVLYNPAPFAASQHFTVAGPQPNESGTNAPSPAFADTNLQIRGNVIWNGNAATPLGIDDENLRASNAINTPEPRLGGDYRPLAAIAAPSFAIPSFSWSDAPSPPAVPAGTLSNAVDVDRDGTPRAGAPQPGAYVVRTAPPPRRRAVGH